MHAVCEINALATLATVVIEWTSVSFEEGQLGSMQISMNDNAFMVHPEGSHTRLSHRNHPLIESVPVERTGHFPGRGHQAQQGVAPGAIRGAAGGVVRRVGA